jgi:hypothetical protein
MKKIIAFSLWGNKPRYTIGAIKNSILAKEYYPGWTARFYVGTDVDESIITSLKENDAEVVVMPAVCDWTGMFWRFLAASDPEVDVMISRDADSRLSLREKAAVDEWLMSDKQFHIMRDNSQHNTLILGGMWGARGGILKNMTHLIDAYNKGNYWQIDQQFLRDIVYPIVRDNAMVHDEYFEKKPWPTPRIGNEFVGDAFDENDVSL